MPMKTKGIDVLCASPASTAICKSTITEPLHRLNSYLGDHYKAFTNNLSNYSPSRAAPCISDLPLTPRRKSSADAYHLRDHHRYKRTNYTSHSSRHLLESLPSDSECHSKECLALPPSPATPDVIRSGQRELRKSRSHTGGGGGRDRVGSFMDLPHKESHNRNKATMSLALANPGDQRVMKSKSPSSAPSRDQGEERAVLAISKLCLLDYFIFVFVFVFIINLFKNRAQRVEGQLNVNFQNKFAIFMSS
ncbi:hypothetical protein Cgig2_003986 [Carnegiea gigantea]|uniref:Uncharacterized protein n=1 Tax=Carnegiea gigantea TaxID=171969 RepID=A0A9Q1QGT6_9CARY|nr:hypothetical protein Cgig2_003986 [Carnegiea gigantea]